MPATESSTVKAVDFLLTGKVQGFGVRPAIARLAKKLKLAGSVQNTLSGLTIRVEGMPSGIERFSEQLSNVLPSGVQVDTIESLAMAPQNLIDFEICADNSDGPLQTRIPPDVGPCETCLSETLTSQNRRSNYGLTTCAACGPRWSILNSMPYERDKTTLNRFPLCRDCQKEYESPADRRYHAQTIGCPQCGPQIWGRNKLGEIEPNPQLAIQQSVNLLNAGKTVALRGIGGYQLLCDAASSAAVQQLREAKHRLAKPFALLVESLQDAEQLAHLNLLERKALTDNSNPIVICRVRQLPNKDDAFGNHHQEEASVSKTEVKITSAPLRLAPEVHPGLNEIGLMLPSSPLHSQIAQSFGRPLVCTSGNLEGDPIVVTPEDSEIKLAGMASYWLHHNRPIARAIDDSVVRVIADRPVTIRLGRGLAPLSLSIPKSQPVMALGAHQKVATSWSNGEQSVLGPHIGDLATESQRERFLDQLQDAQSLYRFEPGTFVCDTHPDYFSSRYATDQINSCSVQHHLAHIASGIVEHELWGQHVLGIAWDGTGLGDDGTIWGGEFLSVAPNFEYQRLAHLKPFSLPGGEAAIREPWRIALAMLHQTVAVDEFHHHFDDVSPSTIKQLQSIMNSPTASPVTSSGGRLFDAAASLILSRSRSEFEGQLAMMLESAADETVSQSYPLPISSDTPRELDWRPMISSIWKDCKLGESPESMSMKFHRGIARGIVSLIEQELMPETIRSQRPVVLSGGVFQNRLLTELIREFAADRFQLKLPGKIPPNDGGLAAGQLAIALSFQ